MLVGHVVVDVDDVSLLELTVLLRARGKFCVRQTVKSSDINECLAG